MFLENLGYLLFSKVGKAGENLWPSTFLVKCVFVVLFCLAFCLPERRPVRSVCSTITGDANLFAMFRLDAKAIDCPFRAPLSFTYNRGHGECRYPVSSVDSCTHPSRLLLNYQACPDVPGTESTGKSSRFSINKIVPISLLTFTFVSIC